jgi:hypothetical protein
MSVILKCTKEEFISNKKLLSVYDERQLVAMHEMLTDDHGDGMFSDVVADRMDYLKLANIVTRTVSVPVNKGAWNGGVAVEVIYTVHLKR